MREILFRGKRKKDGAWVYGYYQKNPVTEAAYVNVTKDIYTTPELVVPETVGQYVGRSDKNGVRIFEGDLLKNGSMIYEVVYSVGSCSWLCGRIDGKNISGLFPEIMEVIGNVHDNWSEVATAEQITFYQTKERE